MSEEENNLRWAIVITNGHSYIGGVREQEKVLSPVFEVLNLRGMSDQGLQNRTVIIPVMGMTGTVIMSLPSECCWIWVSELEEQDQRLIIGLVQECMQNLKNIRAERSGIELATEIPNRRKH
jgi:hypothetical protein